jgi:SOS-response transcriptional repressor LexA
MDVIDRLIAAVDASGLKRVRIAEDARMSPAKLSKILSRKQVPTVLEFIAVAGAIRVNPGLLFTDQELVVDVDKLRDAHASLEKVTELLATMLPPQPSASSIVSKLKPLPSRAGTPVRAAANPNAELVVEFERERKLIPLRMWNRGAHIIARAIGDSMDGGRDPIRDGELVYLWPTRNHRNVMNKVALVRRGDALYLKRFEKRGRMVYLISENGADAIEIDARAEKDQLQTYGYVIGHAAE